MKPSQCATVVPIEGNTVSNCSTLENSRQAIPGPVEKCNPKRRKSFDSLGATAKLEVLGPDVTLHMMPRWLRYVLVCGGGWTGQESNMVNFFVLFCVFGHVSIIGFALWTIGLPLVPECVVCCITGYTVCLTSQITRMRFLKSGVLWSLAKEIDPDGRVIAPFNEQSRMLLLDAAFEALLLNPVWGILGFVLDPAGVTESFTVSSRILSWLALLVNVFLQTQFQCSFKAIPLLFNATCKLLEEDINRFHAEVDTIFTQDFSESEQQVRHRLQQMELAMRARQVAVNKVVAPGLTCFIGVMIAGIMSCIILVFRAKAVGSSPGIIVFYCLIIVLNFAVMVFLLFGAACVGDRWLQLLDDLNTPELCASTVSVLGVTLVERLYLLRNVGVQIFGYALTSQTVMNISVSIAGGLFLTVISAMLSGF